VLDYGRAAFSPVGAAKAAPARPEDDREHEPCAPTTIKMIPTAWMLSPATVALTAQVMIRTGGDHQETDCCAHVAPFALVVSRDAGELWSPQPVCTGDEKQEPPNC
jgi:hypothetical protein